MPVAQDTEITLGTGKMLALFFGLVALCALFFGMGFKMGKNSVVPAISVGETSPVPVSNPGVRPSAVKSANDANTATSPDVAFYKSSGQKDTSSTAPAEAAAGSAAAAPTGAATGDEKPASDANATAPSPSSSYFVQVAAVSKQEDAEALVDALKKKQYPAFAATGPDKLFHVQVGPFSDIKSAEDMRSKLVSDGYNPILKK